ncbi:MAG TPA: hypothetical protein VEC36_13285 [Patescibacteria group bacterium]|nr:hypothetical protein [Patescibacteria group bacterium]
MDNAESDALLKRCSAKYNLRVEFSNRETSIVGADGLYSIVVTRSATDRQTGETVYLKMFDVIHSTWNMLLQRKLDKGGTEDEFKKGWAHMQVVQMCEELVEQGLA